MTSRSFAPTRFFSRSSRIAPIFLATLIACGAGSPANSTRSSDGGVAGAGMENTGIADAGPAAPLDAGSPVVGMPDGGACVGRVCFAPHDAGEPDSGAPVTVGQPDSGVPVTTGGDAGLVVLDAGHPDAGACERCTCSNGTCPIDSEGDCDDYSNCLLEACRYCTCASGSCGSSTGACFDESGNCFDETVDAGERREDAGVASCASFYEDCEYVPCCIGYECVDDSCQVITCLDLGEPCTTSGECCTGSCVVFADGLACGDSCESDGVCMASCTDNCGNPCTGGSCGSGCVPCICDDGYCAEDSSGTCADGTNCCFNGGCPP